MLVKKRIICIDVSVGTDQTFIENILELGRKRQSAYVCFANVHMLVEASFSAHFQQVVNEADLVAPDGIPIAKAFKLLYRQQQQRVDGMRFLPLLLPCLTEQRQSVFFYGSTPEMLEATRVFLQKNHPLLLVAGMYAPPFRPLSVAERELVAEKITASGANVVLVVLGCPKQELWMSEMKGKIPAVMLGIGAALPVLIHKLKRAPLWVQKCYLEWLFRVAQDPRRLLKRYVVTNSVFAGLLIKEIFRKKFLKVKK